MLYQNVIDGVIMQYHKETENSVFNLRDTQICFEFQHKKLYRKGSSQWHSGIARNNRLCKLSLC